MLFRSVVIDLRSPLVVPEGQGEGADVVGLPDPVESALGGFAGSEDQGSQEFGVLILVRPDQDQVFWTMWGALLPAEAERAGNGGDELLAGLQGVAEGGREASREDFHVGLGHGTPAGALASVRPG